MLEQVKRILPHLSTAYSVRWKVSTVANAAGKIEAKYNCQRRPLPDSLLKKHFLGESAVSVQPLLDDGTSCKWGAIDVDNYGDPELVSEVRRKLALLNIPAFVEKSKSGAAHAYFILDEPVDAKAFRKGLRKIACWLGYPDAELRPASNSIKVSEGDLGHFMVLPGFGAGLEAMVSALTTVTLSVDRLNEILDLDIEFADGPPCLFPLKALNQAQGTWSSRNLYLYQLAVYFKYSSPADWADKVRQFNAEEITPSLPGNEVEAMVKQLEKNGTSHYICNKEPFESVCDRQRCALRKFGVAARDGIESIVSTEGITVLDTDPPLWFMSLVVPSTNETVRVKLTTQQLHSVKLFKKRCMEVMKSIPLLPPQEAWEKMLTKLLEDVTVLPVPFEMTEHARILDLIYRFCLTSIKCTSVEDVLTGRIFVVKHEDGFVAKFRMVDFVNFLERYKYRGIATSELYSVLQELSDAEYLSIDKMKIGPLELDLWSIHVTSQYLELKMELDLEDK
jgi:hypothetical protein